MVTALEILRVIARRGRPIAELAAEIPLLPQQQRTIPARHKDQWEGDPVLQRALAEATARLGAEWPDPRPTVRDRTRPAGHGRGRRTPTLVGQLADEISTLAGERLN